MSTPLGLNRTRCRVCGRVIVWRQKPVPGWRHFRTLYGVKPHPAEAP